MVDCSSGRAGGYWQYLSSRVVVLIGMWHESHVTYNEVKSYDTLSFDSSSIISLVRLVPGRLELILCDLMNKILETF